MKTHFLIIISILFITSCKSKKSATDKHSNDNKYTILSKEKINISLENRAYLLGKRLLESCNTSKFIPFTTSEATDKVIANATVEKISETCKKINVRNGKFIGLELIDVTQDTDTKDLIYRYNIMYEKKLYQREIKITMNTDNKIAAINTKEIAKVL